MTATNPTGDTATIILSAPTARIAGDTVLRYDLNDCIPPHCMFVTPVERALIKRGMEDGGHAILLAIFFRMES